MVARTRACNQNNHPYDSCGRFYFLVIYRATPNNLLFSVSGAVFPSWVCKAWVQGPPIQHSYCTQRNTTPAFPVVISRNSVTKFRVEGPKWGGVYVEIRKVLAVQFGRRAAAQH